MPVLSTKTRPVSTRRLSSGGRPPLGLATSGGKTGSMSSHNASSSTGWAMNKPPYQGSSINTEQMNIDQPKRHKKVLLETLKRLDLLSISRPRIHWQRLVSLSAAATRRFFCYPYSLQRLGHPRRWATALPSVDDPLLETRDDLHVLQCHALPIAALESRRPSPPQRRAAVTGDQSIRSRQHRDRLWASLVYRNRVWVSQIQRLPLGRNPIDPAPKTAPFNRSTRGRAPMVSAPWTARA